MVCDDTFADDRKGAAKWLFDSGLRAMDSLSWFKQNGLGTVSTFEGAVAHAELHRGLA